MKNPATKRARALRRLDARRTLAMTGTPIENRLDELWAIMDIVNPGLLGSRERFQRSFARPIEANGDARALERLRAMVQPFILRRPKDSPEVELELPKITVTKEYCKLTLEQASLYQATVDRWMPRIEEHERSFGRRGAVLAMLGQLKQVCNHPEMVLATGRPLAGRSGKLERLVELLEAMPADDKALVFTQYPGFDRLVPHLHERLGREIGFFHGGLAARQRDELVAAFSHPERPVGARDLDPGRRPRPQPAGREPRLPLRPLVEPRRRAAGDRPRLPVRPAQGRLRAQPHLHGDARGADRRAARLEARAGGEGRRRPRRRLARRARPRRDPRRRRRSPTTPSRRPHDARSTTGARSSSTGDDDRIGRGPWARWVATSVVPDEGSPRAERGRILARTGHVHSVTVVRGRDLGARDRLERRRVRRQHRGRPGAAARVGGGDRLASRAPLLRGRRCRTRAVAAAGARDDGRLGRAADPARAGRASHVQLPRRRPHRHLQARRSRSPTSSPMRSTTIRRSCSSGAAAPRSRSRASRWRCGQSRRRTRGQPAPLPELGPARPLPVGSVLKRLGRSGLVVDGADLRDALEPAYAAFAGRES